MKRHLLVAAAAFTGLFMLAAVGAGTFPGKTAAPAASAGLRDCHAGGLGVVHRRDAAAPKVLDAFEKKYPKIKVDYTPIAGDYQRRCWRSSRRGSRRTSSTSTPTSSPDWVSRAAGAAERQVKRQVQDEPVLPAAPERLQDKEIYGFPKDWSPLGMVINTSMLGKVKRHDADGRGPQLGARSARSSRFRAAADLSAPSWERLLAFVYQNGGTFLNAAKTKSTVNTPAGRAGRELLRRPAEGRPRRDAGPARRRLVRRGVRQGEGRDRLRGQLARPVHGREFPTSSSRTAAAEGKKDGNLAFTVSYSMARYSKNKKAAWKLLRTSPASRDEDVDVEGSRCRRGATSSRSPAAGRFIAAAPSARPWQFAPGSRR